MDRYDGLERDEYSHAPEPDLEHIDGLDQRLVIAVDFGTTYTGIAYKIITGAREEFNEENIVTDWSVEMNNDPKVPSVIAYDESDSTKLNWGKSLSEEAIAMLHTKLQLHVQENAEELDSILHLLDGTKNLKFSYIMASETRPRYTWKTPEEIVCDYLKRVFEAFNPQLEHRAHLTAKLRSQFITDIVLTIPAGWAYRAKNAVFRALTQAGFNKETFPELRDILVISEPEAAALYTARFLKERDGKVSLEPDDVFILTDAGGGTVDLTSYRVVQVEPTFEIEAITTPRGDTCGSVFVDMRFKAWLLELLGEELYTQIDPEQITHRISSHSIEGPKMRQLMSHFNILKVEFDGTQREMAIDLPEPLHNENLPGRVHGGQVVISNAQMKDFFSHSANKTINLLKKEIRAASLTHGKRLKNIFLVGGFAQSPYLQSVIRGAKAIKDNDIEVFDPHENSWTAVVRGALIYGIEKSKDEDVPRMTGCKRSYAIVVNTSFVDYKDTDDVKVTDPLSGKVMAENKILYLVQKGDLITTTAPRISEKWFTRRFSDTSSRKGKIALYSYDGTRPPTNFLESWKELQLITHIDYDLSDVELDRFQKVQKDPSLHVYYVAFLQMKFSISVDRWEAELHWGDQLLQKASSKYV